MGTQLDGWRDLSKDQRHANVVAWAKTQPLVENAGIDPDSNTVWIEYTDGTGSFYIDNKEPPLGAITATRPPITRAKVFPEDTSAYAIFSVESYFSDSTPWLSQQLNSNGYTCAQQPYPDIAQVLSMNNAGVIYWESHAGFSKHKDNGVWNPVFVLLTGEEADEALSSGAYKAYIDAGEVQTGNLDIRVNGAWKTIQAYAITDRFVAKHMHLSPGSFVAIDACQTGNVLFANAWKKAGAGTFVGWDQNSGKNSDTPMMRMFDRLLGTNLKDPITPNPPERPFNVEATQLWMQENGFDKDPSSTATMKFYHATAATLTIPSTLALLPTASRLLLEGKDATYAKSKLFIEGSFGPKPSTNDYDVTWGGTKLDIIDWKDVEGIRVKIPDPPPVGSIVIRRDTRKSNPVPMTEWILPVKYTMTGRGTLKYVVDFKLKIHADVHWARYFPQDIPSGVPTPIWHLSDSTATVTASGQYKPDVNTTITWSDGINSKSYDMTDHANSIAFAGQIDMAAGQIKDFFLFNNSTYTVKNNGAIVSKPAAAVEGYFQFNIPISKSTYVISSGAVSPTQSISSPYCVSATLTFGPATPVSGTQPTPSTPR